MAGPLNGIPILGGPKMFVKAASDATISDRGMYDLAHFLFSQMHIANGQQPPPWGMPLELKRPLGNGMFVATTYVVPDEEPEKPADTSNDA